MRSVCAAIAVFSLLAGCATTPEADLAKQMAHCAVIADNLSKVDSKYKQWSGNFMGAGATLVSNQAFLQMMVSDRTVAPTTPEQKAAMEKEADGCQTLMMNNMDKFGAGNPSGGTRSRFLR